MQQDVSVGQREKGVYEHKHRYEDDKVKDWNKIE